MKLPSRRIGFPFLALVALATVGYAPTARASIGSAVEVVQSYPIETNLQVTGIAQTQAVWLDLVNSATRTLDIEQYYINNVAGESLDPIINAIKAAASRGVQVRIILDSAFLKENAGEADCLANIANVSIRQIDFSPGIMHAKYFVADGVNAYTGSANMDWLALTHIHEMGLHTVDATIGASLESIFNTDWPNAEPLRPASGKVAGAMSVQEYIGTASANFAPAQALFAPSDFSGLPGFTVVASPKSANPSSVPDTLDTLIAMMATAKTSLQIQVYEYSTTPFSGKGDPWTPLDKAIRAAAARQVQVQLIVDATVESAKSKTELAALSKLPNISVKAVTIPQWSGGHLPYARLIHSKYFVIDGNQGWVGSENWLDSYFLATRNVGITVQNGAIAAQLAQVFKSVWTSTYAVSQ